MELIFLSRTKSSRKKTHSQPWFIPTCAAAIAHRNHHFHAYHRNPSDANRNLFRTSSNRCKYILNQTKTNYADLIQSRIESESLGTREFWRITNNVMDRGKPSIPTIVNDPEILSPSSDKAILFSQMFSSNSTFADQGHPLPEFPLRTSINLTNMKITPSDVAKSIRRLDNFKAVGPDAIPVVVLKNLITEIAPKLPNFLTDFSFSQFFQIRGRVHQSVLSSRM